MTKRTAQTEKPALSNPTQPNETEPTPTTPPPAEAPAPAQEGGRRPFEEHLGGLSGWQVAALKAHTRWPAGFEASAEEVEAKLAEATGQVIE